MEWVGPVVAAVVTAIGVGIAAAVAARAGEKWLPGQLRRARQLSAMIELLDAESAVTSALRRERDEALQAWVLRTAVPSSRLIVATAPFLVAMLGLVILAGAGLVVVQIVTLIATVHRVGVSGLVLVLFAFAIVGALLSLSLLPIVFVGSGRRNRAADLARVRLGFGQSLSAEIAAVVKKDLEDRKGSWPRGPGHAKHRRPVNERDVIDR